MKRSPLAALSVVVLLSGPAALSGCAAEPPARIEGLVTGALDASPLEGAVVRVEGTELWARTDASGRFALDVPAGEHRVHVLAPGHLGGTRVRTVAAAGRVARADLALFPASPSDAAVDARLALLEQQRHLRDDPNDPALRAEARAFLRGEILEAPGGDIGAVRASLDAPPATIRLWRRSIDGQTDSCLGQIEVIDLEDYIAGVLPHEWIPSWHDESLRAGALAIRTYAWGWIARGGKYTCADLDDTTRSQVYRDDRNDRATAAVEATRGMAITSGGVLVSGEYSAENGDPTAYGVVEPLCTGRTVNGHGRGMCQWGSQRWALDGRDAIWIATHYYLDSIVESAGGPPLPSYDASYVAQSVPAAMTSGERAQVYVELRNEGSRTWDLSGTRLRTSSPDDHASPFYDRENWIDDHTATAPDAGTYARGAAGRFTFMITAPEVTSATTITDTFRLGQDGVGPFGPEVTLSVLVSPRGGVAPPADGGAGTDAGGGGEPPPPGMLSSGCAITSRAGSRAGSQAGSRAASQSDSQAWWPLALLLLAYRRRGTPRRA